ncbi:MAG: hypothetical protein WCH21_11175 [Bacteroidota bacterium]
MNQLIKENRGNNFTPVYKNYKQDLKPVSEINTFHSDIIFQKKDRKINLDSNLAEETVNAIIDYFNEHARLNDNFSDAILKNISKMEFAYPNDNEKLQSIIHKNATSSFKVLSQGMKNILDAFNKYNHLAPKSTDTHYEDIDFTIEPPVENHNSYSAWVGQTIDEPWFK